MSYNDVMNSAPDSHYEMGFTEVMRFVFLTSFMCFDWFTACLAVTHRSHLRDFGHDSL